MDDNKQFRDSGRNMAGTRGGKRPWLESAVSLGDVAKELFDRRIAPRYGRLGNVAEVWEELLPAELNEHCRLAGFGQGQLNVVADGSSYVNELNWCSGELLDELRRRCPRAGIKRIKISVG